MKFSLTLLFSLILTVSAQKQYDYTYEEWEDICFNAYRIPGSCSHGGGTRPEIFPGCLGCRPGNVDEDYFVGNATKCGSPDAPKDLRLRYYTRMRRAFVVCGLDYYIADFAESLTYDTFFNTHVPTQTNTEASSSSSSSTLSSQPFETTQSSFSSSTEPPSDSNGPTSLLETSTSLQESSTTEVVTTSEAPVSSEIFINSTTQIPDTVFSSSSSSSSSSLSTSTEIPSTTTTDSIEETTPVVTQTSTESTTEKVTVVPTTTTASTTLDQANISNIKLVPFDILLIALIGMILM